MQGLGVLLVLYFIFAIPATTASLVASRRREWKHPDGGKRLLFTLWGSPLVLVFSVVGWAMKSNH